MKKNRLLLVFLVVSALITGCSKEKLKNSDVVQKEKTKANSAGDGLNDLLGYGYDVTGEYANSSAAKFAVVDVNRLKADQPSRVEWDLSKRQDGILVAGKDAYSYTKGLTAKVSGHAGTGVFFKATVSSRYSDSTAFNSNYIYSSFQLMIQQKRVKFNADIALLKSYLNSAFVADVQNTSAQNIVNKYGTHVLSDIVLGAKLEVLYRSETNKEDRYTASAAGIDVAVKTIFSINTSYSYNSSDTKDNFKHSLHYRTWGGDPSRAILGEVPVGQTTPVINISNWQSSSSVSNAEMINISKDGLILISELIEDPVKKAAVEAYTIKYLNDHNVKLLPGPIYEYYNPQINKHAYDINPNMNELYPGWNPNDQLFRAFTNEYGGAVPVYQFSSPRTGDHIYTTNRYPGLSGYDYNDPLFYAYATRVAGTVPIYEFYNPGIQDHFYSPDLHAADPFPGWRYNSTPFYAFLN